MLLDLLGYYEPKFQDHAEHQESHSWGTNH